MKYVVREGVQYAAQRKQFNRAIAEFGLIREKLARVAAQIYAAESMAYRAAGAIDAAIARSDGSARSAMDAIEEYAIEASIMKVTGSEWLFHSIDEVLQIHGGNGFVEDYPIERAYRDNRVNRIFEGTNEINRLLIPGMLIRRALKGDLPLIPAAKALQDELLSPSPMSATDEGVLADERAAVAACKKVALMVFGLAMQTYGQKLSDEQEVLMHLADITMDVYAAESATLRAAAASQRQDRGAALHVDAARVFVSDAALRIDASARQALAAMSDGDTLRTMLAALRRLLKVTPINTVAARRRLADETVARGGYIFG
jgi:alkylation response protein AidB-like acyl-CoA dehydrogenase